MTDASSQPPARRIVHLSGGFAFVASFVVFATQYAGRFGAPDTGADATRPILINVLLFAAFGAHHSVMARSGVKARLADLVDPRLERTVYVWTASLLFTGLSLAWLPVPGYLWHVAGWPAWIIRTAPLVSVGLILWAGRYLDLGSLAGTKPILTHTLADVPVLVDRGPYALVRHPLNLALAIAVWGVPVMTNTRLVFAILATAYLLVAIPLEERDLRRHFGAEYDRYARRVTSRLIPGLY